MSDDRSLVQVKMIVSYGNGFCPDRYFPRTIPLALLSYRCRLLVFPHVIAAGFARNFSGSQLYPNFWRRL